MSKAPPVEQSSIEEARRSLGRTTVFAVGVSSYTYLEPLPGAAKDLKLMREMFLNKKGYGVYSPSQFREFANPTIEEVRTAILEYAYARSARGDIAVFYFSGHGCVVGASDFGFCLADSMVNLDGVSILPLSILSFRDIVQTLSSVDIHPVFIIDACFSGSTAQTFRTNINAVLQDDLHTYAAGSYGLLCLSNAETPSVDTDDGGVFTKAICSIVSEGLSDQRQRHWPFLTIRGIRSPLQEKLTREGYPLPRCYVGPDLPEIPIAKNKLFKPQSEYFAPYMRRIIEYIWNKGTLREVTIAQLRDVEGLGAYGNHRKLSYAPWALLEDGQRKRSRRLTRKGERFARGKVRIPERIIKDPVSWKWVAAPGTKRILITDIPYMEKMF